MSNIAIKVEGLGKEYIIGHKKEGDLRNSFRQKIDQIFNGSQSKESFWALKDVSFEVKKGEAIGIIGRNGAGKSTLLKILSRITEPTTGRFEINGRVSSLLEVGTGFHPELSGRENIYLNGTILGMKRAEIKSKFDEIIDFSGVEKFIDTPVKHYSSGMKVRLAFSVAAHLEPEILIVDEVLAVGDAEFQKKCLGKMNDVSKNEGRTVVFVSHNMAAIQNLCSRALVIHEGESSFEGDVYVGIDYYLKSSSTLFTTSLNLRKDRIGGGGFKFIDVGIENKDKIPIRSIVSGMKCFFNIFYSNNTSISIIGVRLLMVDQNKTTRILSNTGLLGKTPLQIDKTERGVVTFIYNKFPLPKGNYTLRLSCFSKNGIEDDIEDAFSFEVEDGDFYGFGRQAAVKDGVLVDFDVIC